MQPRIRWVRYWIFGVRLMVGTRLSWSALVWSASARSFPCPEPIVAGMVAALCSARFPAAQGAGLTAAEMITVGRRCNPAARPVHDAVKHLQKEKLE
jgi:hypothetical protein